MAHPITCAAEPAASTHEEADHHAMVRQVADQLAGALRHGMAFRQALAGDDAALTAAAKLIERLRAAGVPGLEERPAGPCGAVHPWGDHLVCQRPGGHDGAHESRGVRWTSPAAPAPAAADPLVVDLHCLECDCGEIESECVCNEDG
jgi:hypothetical protein